MFCSECVWCHTAVILCGVSCYTEPPYSHHHVTMANLKGLITFPLQVFQNDSPSSPLLWGKSLNHGIIHAFLVVMSHDRRIALPVILV